jgi:serine-type D-Ala-D-Ala carboxypeptidase/endopeptidase (penicillin-binding protein 4)
MTRVRAASVRWITAHLLRNVVERKRSMLRLPCALFLVALVAALTFARPGSSEPDGTGTKARGRAQGGPSAAPVLLTAASATSVAASKLNASSMRKPLEKLVADVRHLGGRIGVLAIDVASGATVAAFDERGLYNPASNAKLFTAAAALRLLGPGYRYVTGLYGTPSDTTIAELVLRGSGDPSLATRDLWEMARDLRNAGVHKVDAITVDQTYFDDLYVPPAFEQQPDEWATFRAPVAAVSLNANAVLFTVRATTLGHAASVTVEPPGLISLIGSVSTAKQGTPEKIGLKLEPQGARLVARLSGHVPEGGRVVGIARRVDDPRLLAAYALREILQDIGVQVTGEVRLGGERQKQLLVAHRSAPLGQLLSALGKDSDNFCAETIFKTLAAEMRGRPGTATAAAGLVFDTLDDLGIRQQGLVVKNGSGLFDANRASPWSIAELLRAAFVDPTLGSDFVAQLAIAGVDGTLRSRLRAWSKERAIRAKTGTLVSVAALSGYVLPPPGKSAIAFSILANDIHGNVDAARRAIDAFIGALASDLWKDAR